MIAIQNLYAPSCKLLTTTQGPLYHQRVFQDKTTVCFVHNTERMSYLYML